MKEFDEAHAAFIQHHLKRRSGERRGRLERGHSHAETLFLKQVWWPLKGSFHDLHPEYEVVDWRGTPYFADFAFAPNLWKVLLEIKGYASHVTDMDRQKYCNELNRETFLSGMGFLVISFAYDDVVQRPNLCVFLLRTVLGRFEPSAHGEVERIHIADREMMRYAVFLARPIRPVDVARHFCIDYRTAMKHLMRLCRQEWLRPVIRGTSGKIMQYEVTKRGLDNGL